MTYTPIETIEIDAHKAKGRITCDGGGALGHPRVYLTLEAGHGETGKGGEIDCPYCGRRYSLKGTAAAH